MKKSKALLLALCAALLVGAVAGTVAYLIDYDQAINTFTLGAVGTLNLTEEDTDDFKNGPKSGDQYLVVPGVDIQKNPTVIYEQPKDSAPVDVYVFVKVEAGEDWSVSQDQLTYTKSFAADGDSAEVAAEKEISFSIAAGWTALKEADGVYYRTVSADETENLSWGVIANDTIHVGENLTKDQIKTLNALDLTFTSYAIQQGGFEDAPADAWAEFKKS